MKHKWVLIFAVIAVLLAAGIIVKVNSSNTTVEGTVETEKLIIEDAIEETDHEFVPSGK